MSKMGEYAMENESGLEIGDQEELIYYQAYDAAKTLGYPHEFYKFIKDIDWLIKTAKLEEKDD